jgi:hypothetical protein
MIRNGPVFHPSGRASASRQFGATVLSLSGPGTRQSRLCVLEQRERALGVAGVSECPPVPLRHPRIHTAVWRTMRDTSCAPHEVQKGHAFTVEVGACGSVENLGI